MIENSEWQFDVYGFRYSEATDVVLAEFKRAGLHAEFHNISTDGPAIQAVRTMEALDGNTQYPRVYMRHGVHPAMNMKTMLFAPTKFQLRLRLFNHELISSLK